MAYTALKIYTMKKTKFEVCEEMQKLRDYLNEKGIEWKDVSNKESELWICRTHFWIGKSHWSVINGFGTYGGFSSWHPKNMGLLELMASAVDRGNPKGFMTAERIIKEIEKQ